MVRRGTLERMLSSSCVSPRRVLSCETKDVAGRTDFTEDTLVVHVLTGLKPVLPRIWLSQPGGPHLSRRYATVTFNAADLGFKELRALYNELREYLGGKGKEGLSLEDWEFWKLIEDMGGPPTKWGTKTQFWKEVQQRWNRDRPRHKLCDTWVEFAGSPQLLVSQRGLSTGKVILPE
jgi:hypothetical protein